MLPWVLPDGKGRTWPQAAAALGLYAQLLVWSGDLIGPFLEKQGVEVWEALVTSSASKLAGGRGTLLTGSAPEGHYLQALGNPLLDPEGSKCHHSDWA